MCYERESEFAKELQNKINQMMKKALSIVEKKENVEVFTDQYSVYKFISPLSKGHLKKTIERLQSVVIKNKSTEDITCFIGTIAGNRISNERSTL